jgi:6-phosphogluconate dehydrogenase
MGSAWPLIVAVACLHGKRAKVEEGPMAGQCELGVTGLATMGANLARNAAGKGFSVAVHNRTERRTRELVEGHGDEGELVGTFSTGEFVGALARPRRVLVMVKAGPAVDAVLEELAGHLEVGDLLIDGGNSWFEDTVRREQALAARGLGFLGTGVSGGEEGALQGPSIMCGGTAEAYGLVEALFTRIAAQVQGVACCRLVGPGGAGHYVKMVHNGIEYADMQLIAEAYDLLGQGTGMGAGALAEVFEGWNAGDLDSFLIEITARVLRQVDQDSGRPLVEVILDQAEQKGTGRWSVQSALELGVPATAITEAVFARVLSSQKPQRMAAAKVLGGPSGRLGTDQTGAFVDDVRDALYASKVVAYAQGFEQIAAAAEAYGWEVELGGLATIWRGGCIIRARFLDRIREAYAADPGLGNLLFADYFRDAVGQAQDAWRRVVATAVTLGVPTPAFASSLAYYDGVRRERGPANLLQAQRDFFGAHTYRRVDRPGSFHTRWSQDGQEVDA